ncbi:ATP-binding protein [Streptomyces sp. NPDC060064]|uniref:ATP-binding protein n=1 Tax=Streptomyces sp. NPDC060064 TaxID=3347049 RepID=UPI0036896FBF
MNATRVCTRTADQRKALFQLPPAPTAPRSARRLVEDVLADWGTPVGMAQSLRLLASELVTNAVAHGDGQVGLALFVTPATDVSPCAVLRMEVADASAEPARQGGLRGDDEHGRGLLLVDALSDQWGQDLFAEGKRVWCEFALAGGPDECALVPERDREAANRKSRS